MQRKTNLFYNTNNDTNFITFSNYGESMTGNYLSTNTKLFPSKFLCLYISKLENDNENKDERINFIQNILCGKYENKLAVLRDYCADNDLNCEKYIKPLNYLLETIFEYDDSAKINFIGDVTEQDYNGVYADTICTINTANTVTGAIVAKKELSDNNIVEVKNDIIDKLHGWHNTMLPEEYSKIVPLYDNIVVESSYVTNRLVINPEGESFTDFDGIDTWTSEDNTEQHIDGYVNSYNTPSEWYTYNGYKTAEYENIHKRTGQYFFDSLLTSINLIKDTEVNDVEFNTVIPLYDTVNISTKTNITNILESQSISLSDTNNLYYNNVPMGMWFADTTVRLNRSAVNGSKNTNFCPSWSLVLSSQFKPFPYSQQIPDEITTNSTADAFQTFSQIMVRQNEILDKFDSVITNMSNLSNRVSALESKLHQIGCAYSLDTLHIEMINWESKMNKRFNDLNDEINSYLSALSWQYRQG